MVFQLHLSDKWGVCGTPASLCGFPTADPTPFLEVAGHTAVAGVVWPQIINELAVRRCDSRLTSYFLALAGSGE